MGRPFYEVRGAQGGVLAGAGVPAEVWGVWLDLRLRWLVKAAWIPSDAR
jgi:hypothetical protein